MTDFTQLIPELPDWNNGRGIDVETWIGCSGKYQLAVGYSTLFWPRFVVFEGYVLREGFSVESLRGFERQCADSRWSVESVMNHLHIASIHYHDLSAFTTGHALYLGRVLREIYEAKLTWQFPDRQFNVVFDESPKEDLMAYEITFYQVDGGT
jgi:hypothetical protein